VNGTVTIRVPPIGEIVRGAAVAALATVLWCAPLWAQDPPPPDPADEPVPQQEPEDAPVDSGAEATEPGAADGEPSADDTADDAAANGAAEDDGTAADDADLDQQTYEADDDVFVPSEEIPVDEPIPFPSDI
jgi:hypothetical protein